MKLRLEAKTKEQELIKAYLEENVSDILADKINNDMHPKSWTNFWRCKFLCRERRNITQSTRQSSSYLL